MKFRICIISMISLFFLSASISAQVDTLWTRTWGDIYEDGFNCVQGTMDAGYIMAGTKGQDDANLGWIVKTDGNGMEEWAITPFWYVYDCTATSIQQTTDMGFIAVWSADTIYPDYRGFLLKIDENGQFQWQQEYPGINFKNVIQTSDQGYLILGNFYADVGYGLLIIKTDSGGEIEWEEDYGFELCNEAGALLQTDDDGFIVVGSSHGFGESFAFIIKMDTSGNEEWVRLFGNNSSDGLSSIQKTIPGGYIMAGHTVPNGQEDTDFWLIKIDENGFIEWQQTYGGTGNDIAYSLQVDPEGGYILAGSTSSCGAGEEDCWIVKADETGLEEWNFDYGGESSDVIKSIALLDDGSLTAAGSTYSYGAGNGDGWLQHIGLIEYHGPVWHISVEGSDISGNGTEFFPFASIQHGIDVCTDGDTILVHPGIYYECIDFLDKLITVGSVFLTTNDPDFIQQTTIFGFPLGSVITFDNNYAEPALPIERSCLCGLKITNGYNIRGGGIYCNHSNVLLTDLIISENMAFAWEGGLGGGLYCDSSNVDLVNVSINDNSCGSFNWTDSGGGIFCDNSTMTLKNVMITGNNAVNFAGVMSAINSTVQVSNTTITENFALGSTQLYTCPLSHVNILNSIIWNNDPYQLVGIFDIQYSCIQGGHEGTGNIDLDPWFTGSGDHPYSLLQDSPCIDTGTPDTTGLNLPPYDIMGNQRIWDGDGDGIAIIDMGAYEYGSLPYVAVEENVIVQIPGIQLHQNFPNPFNPETTISYFLPSSCAVELKIYNIKGQLVKTLVDETVTAGNHTTVWCGDDNNQRKVPSGIYLYRLKTKAEVKIRKMILLK